MDCIAPQRLGWHPDVPDPRDYDLNCAFAKKMMRQCANAKTNANGLPGQIDLREYFPAVRNQHDVNSSSAHACTGLVEYFDRRAFGDLCGLSRLFLHQTTMKLMRMKGNAATSLRTSLKAMKRFGLPPEGLWPYEPQRTDEEPEAHLYSFSNKYSRVRYVRLDDRTGNGLETLRTVKGLLTAGFPCAFGFSVTSSITRDADIPYRPVFDAICGGHAVVAVGYDDRRAGATRGALQIRNSWGEDWGDEGYGWLPYAYVEQRLATDFWTVLRADWIKHGNFDRPRLPNSSTTST